MVEVHASRSAPYNYTDFTILYDDVQYTWTIVVGHFMHGAVVANSSKFILFW